MSDIVRHRGRWSAALAAVKDDYGATVLSDTVRQMSKTIIRTPDTVADGLPPLWCTNRSLFYCQTHRHRHTTSVSVCLHVLHTSLEMLGTPSTATEEVDLAVKANKQENSQVAETADELRLV